MTNVSATMMLRGHGSHQNENRTKVSQTASEQLFAEMMQLFVTTPMSMHMGQGGHAQSDSVPAKSTSHTQSESSIPSKQMGGIGQVSGSPQVGRVQSNLTQVLEQELGQRIVKAQGSQPPVDGTLEQRTLLQRDTTVEPSSEYSGQKPSISDLNASQNAKGEHPSAATGARAVSLQTVVHRIEQQFPEFLSGNRWSVSVAKTDSPLQAKSPSSIGQPQPLPVRAPKASTRAGYAEGLAGIERAKETTTGKQGAVSPQSEGSLAQSSPEPARQHTPRPLSRSQLGQSLKSQPGQSQNQVVVSGHGRTGLLAGQDKGSTGPVIGPPTGPSASESATGMTVSPLRAHHGNAQHQPLVQVTAQPVASGTQGYHAQGASPGTPATLNLQSADLYQNFASLVHTQVQNNVQTLQVQVHPQGMGPITVAVSHQPQGLVVQVTAANPVTAAWLQQESGQLLQAVQTAGLNVTTVAVGLGQQQNESGQQHKSNAGKEQAAPWSPRVGNVGDKATSVRLQNAGARTDGRSTINLEA